MEEIERQLKARCADDSRLRLLEAQWEYDKHLLAQALQAVGSTYPHYSRHDVSHSNTILVNVTRVLGGRIACLAATDLWLLLEAAYWHDVGMIVTDDQLRHWWSTEQFRAHVEQLVQGSDGSLAAWARLLRGGAELEGRAAWPIDIRQALTFVAADFFRARHADGSAAAVRHPLSLRIESPRTLIPQRLFEWLARICLAHGLSREEVMNLPFQENGMGRDHCHPRFVAHMLRLGDLLDLDNGRFCPVLLAQAGRLPASSSAHIGKHASISRFCVVPERVDVQAVCAASPADGEHVDPHAAFQAVSQWFAWLEDEMKHLAVRWSGIVPRDLGGGPPSIGTLRAELSGYEFVPGHQSPSFSIDPQHFLDLSKSSSLFGSPRRAWQRELVANAVDATLIRLWSDLDSDQRRTVETAADPIGEMSHRAENYPICIYVKQHQSSQRMPGAWDIRIVDRGCGLGLDDIRALQVVGSSRRNRARQELIAEMPEALRPTGSFGLGFQSVFLDTEHVEVTTRHAASAISRRVILRRAAAADLRDPTTSDSGVYIQRLDSDLNRRRDGTEVSFRVTRGPQAERRPLDPLADAPAVDAEWLRDFEEVCRRLPVPVFFNGRRLNNPGSNRADVYFDSASSMRIIFFPDSSSDAETRDAYRGAEIGKVIPDSEGGLAVSADLYAGRASDFLEVDRTGLTDTGRAEFLARFHRAFPVALTAYLAELRRTPRRDDGRALRLASLRAQEYGMSDLGPEWKSSGLVSRSLGDGTMRVITVDQVLPQETVRLAYRSQRIVPGVTFSRDLDPDLIVVMPLAETLTRKLLSNEFREFRWLECTPTHPLRPPLWVVNNVLEASKTSTDREPVEEEAFKVLAIPQGPGRPLLPAPRRYQELILPGTFFEEWTRTRAMLSPFTFELTELGGLRVKIDHVDRYTVYIANERAKARLAPIADADLVRASARLLQELDGLYRPIRGLECEYDVQAAIGALERRTMGA